MFNKIMTIRGLAQIIYGDIEKGIFRLQKNIAILNIIVNLSVSMFLFLVNKIAGN